MACWPHPWMSWSLPVSKKLENFEWGMGVPSFGGRKLAVVFVVGSSYETLSFGVLRKSHDAVDRNGWILFNAEKKLTWMLRGSESFLFIRRGAAPWTRFGWQSWWSCCRQWLILRERPSWDARRVFEDRRSPQERRLTVYLFLFLFSKTKQ